MSTTLGISTIVAPIIAINLGGPGALIGFLLTSFLGSAATYAEVNLSIQHRKTLGCGTIMGGPMQYLKNIVSPFAAKWYAVCCLILMTAWSGAQANQLAAIFDSPLLGDYRVPVTVSGAVIAVLVVLTLMGGIKRISALSAKLVPVMFVLYTGSCLWILICNADQLSTIFQTILQSAFAPYSMASGALVGGIVSSLRWGVFKGTQACEAGIGTQAIPHSMAETQDPAAQAALAMFSTYTAGILAFLSGCVALVTNTWQDPALPLGISMVAASFQSYFSYFGVIIIAVSTLLFGFGTSLGNSYNGSQCFGFLTHNKKVIYYSLCTGVMIFIGAISDVKTFWSMIDIVLAAVAVPHIAALVLFSCKKPVITTS
jgi:AGCS family alanine or glycine:cation symporter